jgi:hypothetical protein
MHPFPPCVLAKSRLDSGEVLHADHVIVAVSEEVAHRLLPSAGTHNSSAKPLDHLHVLCDR